MKLLEAMKNVRKDGNKSYVNLADMVQELDLDFHIGYDVDAPEGVIEKYHLGPWMCTDTWVGSEVLYFRGEPIALTMQQARKDDTSYYWVSKEKYISFVEYLMSLVTKPAADGVELIEDEDIGEGYRVNYASQLLDKEVIHKETGTVVEVVKRYGLRYEQPYTDWHLVDVKMPDGTVLKRQSLEDQILVPWRIEEQGEG